MTQKIGRREFLKGGAAFGAAAVFGSIPVNPRQTPAKSGGPDLAVAKGADSFAITSKALEALGGIKAFVPKGSSVGLVINAPTWWKRPGSHTHPEVVLAVILACQEAGAKDIQYLIDPAADFWSKTQLSAKYKAELGAVKKCSGNFVGKDVPQGRSLKKTKLIKEFLDCDVVINLPIIKHHVGVNMSGNLKNLMGVNDTSSNNFFHSGSGSKTEYGDVPFLSQCIADLNTLRRPALCVADATEFLLTNGPEGPGELRRLQTVVAGVDPVAVDSYGAAFVNLKAAEVLMIKKSAEAGIGRYDVEKLNVRQIAV
jgi:uncharacterized protein (DUF362 family)